MIFFYMPLQNLHMRSQPKKNSKKNLNLFYELKYF
jgi:hypothetical protein